MEESLTESGMEQRKKIKGSDSVQMGEFETGHCC